MRTVAAEDRLLDEAAPQDAFDTVLDQPPGAATRARIQALRATSDQYLDHALG